MTLREAINSAIDEEMERDPNVFVMGKYKVFFGGQQILKYTKANQRFLRSNRPLLRTITTRLTNVTV